MKYHVARGKEQLGTFSDLDVMAGLRSGRFQSDDLCWTEGMEQWQTLKVRMKVEEVDEDPILHQPINNPVVSALVLSSPGRRLLAKLIDWTMVFTPMIVMLMAMMDEALAAEIKAAQDNPMAVMEAIQRQALKLEQAGSTTLVATSWMIILILVGNMALLTMRGQSLGKCLCGIRIVRAGDGGKAGFVRVVLLRWFLFAVVQSLQVIGPILAFVDYGMVLRPDKRCLHDHVADTLVVNC